MAAKRNYNGQKPLVETNGKYGFDLKHISILKTNYISSRDYGEVTFYLLSLRHLSSDLNLTFNFVLFSRVLTEGNLPQKLFQKRKDQPSK